MVRMTLWNYTSLTDSAPQYRAGHPGRDPLVIPGVGRTGGEPAHSLARLRQALVA